MLWYYKLLARRPHFVVVSIGVFSVACIVVALVAKQLPDFDDPTLGFEARGTSIGRRWTAWRNLLEETSPSGRLMANPKDLLSERESTSVVGFGGKFGVLRKRKKNKKAYDSGKKWPKLRNGNAFQILKELNALNKSVDGEMINFQEYDKNNDTFHLYHDNWAYGKNVTFYTEESDNKTIEKKWSKWKTLQNLEPPPHILQKHSPVDEFFCESPNKEFAHFVVQRVNYNLNDTLFELNAFLAMCDLEQKIVRTERYEDLCQKELTRDNCCRPWSVVNYVTLLANKTSCFELNEEDIAMVKTLLFDCFQYYNNMKLSNDCTMSSCVAPVECKQHNAVYNILHYLADVDFIKLNESAEFLNATMIFLPIARSTKALEFYHSLRKENLGNDLVAVVAIDMGLKNALFDEVLLRDGWLVGLGGIFVVISMWLYTKSLFVTLMTVVAVTFSLGIAYFIYTVIFELSFFPFMNLLAVIVVVGIGADDAFIFLKIWQCVQVDQARNRGRVNPPSSSSSPSASTSRATADSLIVHMGSTLKHAAVSMLVTSLTTAAAFYASYVSSITAIRCFGIFSGTAVMANYLLMITWLPAAVSIAERIKCAALAQPHEAVLARLATPFGAISHLGSKVEHLIISAVISVPLLWIVLLGIIGILSGVMVLHWPKLRLPDSPDFKLFISSHPFERYDSEYRDMFWFEKIYGTSDLFKLPLRFVWGVQPVDRGNFLDPERRGQLYFDESFNMSAPESQQWLLGFCKSLKNQTFYQMSSGMLLPNCFIENFINWMSRRCNDTMEENDRAPCCEVSPFPFAPDVFDACLPDSISSLYATPREIFIPGVAGPKFARQVKPETGSLVKAVVVEYESNQMFTMSYGEIDEFVRTVEEWFGRMLADAPVEMRNGWFTSELEFFDLQDTLSTGTLVAICMAMAVGLLVLLLVTLNVLISLYAIVTVTLSILTTVAVLVLAGWKLNVLESVAVSTAIGLAVDFSLHYGVHYRLATCSDRTSSTRFSLTRMIGPTAMAALTTGIAGALMLPSTVLAYIQIGLFLVIVMSISWIYATFFLMSLLRLFGPQHGFGQFRYPRLRTTTRRDSANTHTDGANQRLSLRNPVSPLLLSNSSSVGCEPTASESHELNSITDSIKPSSLEDSSQPINFERVLQSPSTGSAITTFLPDDVESR